MSWMQETWRRIRSFGRRDAMERGLDEEIRFHLDRQTEKNLRAGMTPDEARRQAHIKFGGLQRARESTRDEIRPALLDDCMRDIRYGMRALRRAPGFTLVAVLTLALGIGSVTVIYSVIHDVLLDPLPYPDSDRFVNVLVQDTETGRVRGVLPAAEFLDYREQSDVFEEVVGTRGESAMLATAEGAEVLRSVRVTPNFFDVMGLRPFIGRTAGPDDVRPDAAPVAILRHRAWVNYFGSDPGIVGRTIRLNGEPRTIVGVMPARFTWHAADVWVPASIDRGAPDARSAPRNFQGRLKRGVTLQQAEAQLNVIAARRARAHPDEYPQNFRVQVVNVIASVVGDFRSVLFTALGAVALLMLIACCNVANMVLARATTREREMTVRSALGAGRGRLLRQLLVESLLLSLAGAAGGCLLAYAGIKALVQVLPQTPLPGEVEFGLDGPALAVSLGVAVLSALLFGIAPALYGVRRDLVGGLKSDGRGVAGGRGRLRNALVAGEIALSLVLLLGAGLLMRSFISLIRVDLGFEPRNILVASVAFAPGDYATRAARDQFFQRALQRIASLPGVDAAAATTNLPPFGGGYTSEIETPGQPRTGRSTALVQFCTEGYFRTLGLRVLRGRELPALAAGDAPRAAVVNQALVASYFRAEDPLGKQIGLTVPSTGTDQETRRLFEIVGVAEDVKNDGIRRSTVPQVYLPGSGQTILVRTFANPSSFLSAIRREIAAVDRGVALRQPDTLEELLRLFAYAQPRFTLIVLSVFAATGTLLVAIGVFSVMAYTVTCQTREIAVRMALGARQGHVMGVVLRLGARLLGLGVGAGLIASYATGRAIASQLWNTSPQDPLILALAVSVVAVVALAACSIPALRAIHVDPIQALRSE
jgi:predicted permease